MRKLLLTLVTMIVAISPSWARSKKSANNQGTNSQIENTAAEKKEPNIYTVILMSNLDGYEFTTSGKIGEHAYVDLELPSGLYWATCNIGAKLPMEAGDFFAWGETEKKSEYNWKSYKWAEITETGQRTDANGEKKSVYKKTQTKYCANSQPGKKQSKADIDTLRTLLPEDDAATAQWGDSWRMPTLAEIEELIKGCDWLWVPNYNKTGVAGIMGNSRKNGNTIFFPAAGFMYNQSLNNVGDFGAYWSSNLEVNPDVMQNLFNPSARSMGFYFGTSAPGRAWVRSNWDDRMFGMLVRAVSLPKKEGEASSDNKKE